MNLVPVRLEGSERASLLVDLAVVNVNLDAQKRRSHAEGLVDTTFGPDLVSHRGFEPSKQVDEPAVLATGQIETPGALLTHEDVDVVGRDTVLLERLHRGHGFVLGVEQTRHPVEECEQMAARVRITIDSGHSLPPLKTRP
jgi:hypothetical protein